MKYGLPYKGSKNKLAEKIVSLLPQADHLIDLFCGGCAVTHCALVRGKYQHVHINDVNWMCPTFFIDALNGKYKDETRWISREDFAELKDKDPYVAFVWSFGNNLRTYLYGEDREDFKKALHYAIFFGDYSLAKDFGMDLSFLDNIDQKNYQKRYFAVKEYGRKVKITPPNSVGVSSEVIINETNRKVCTWTKNKRLLELSSVERLYNPIFSSRWKCRILQQCSNRSFVAQFGGGKINLTSSISDYESVEIPQNSVIYCDIPYEGTDDYTDDGLNSFDYERFYAWCERQMQPVFISSYNMPSDRFDCIEEYEHRAIFSQKHNNLVIERVFVPKHQKERGRPRPKQLSLFE